MGDLLGLWASIVAGAVLLLVSWWGASASAEQSRQVFWIDIGVVGVIVAGVGIAAWLLTGRRAIGERRVALLPTRAATPSAAVRPASAGKEELVSAPGLTRYHRAGCPMVVGKATRTATDAGHRAAGLEPCGICRPGQ
jgi:hypothetical protein